MTEGKKTTNKLFIEDIWNDLFVAMKHNRPLVPRQHVWAGEIGRDHWTRYQKMIGTPITNEFDERILRKFAAGDIFEELVGRMFSLIGLIRSQQEYIEVPETDKTLRITGKIDYIAGLVNWLTARETIEKDIVVGTPGLENVTTDDERVTHTKNLLLGLVDQLEKRYPKGIQPTPIEVKTVNSMLFWAKKDYLDEAYPHHIFQLFTYLKAKNLPEGIILYLSKDDMTIKEMRIRLDDKKIEQAWQADVEKMTEYIRTNTEPPKPEFIIFDPRGTIRFQHNKEKFKVSGEWKPNYEVAWNPYFKMLTGFDNVEAWEESLKPEMKKRNDEHKEQFKIKNNLTK